MDRLGIKNMRSMSLDNGLQIYVNERHRAPVVTVQAWIKTGSIHEEAYLGCGISHFLEHMLFHGSRNYPGQKIIDEVHALGGDMNAYTALEHTVYYICLLYTSDAADDTPCVDLGGCRLIKKKKYKKDQTNTTHAA
eukprot:TRINITY_DN13235_c0_g1_i3.p1 TRINITY_DN13235_c0_g1~~TRINITY_DN13235_c0_g1_i3.p1  ORF type:complete len:136 (-),score=23.17 TRINITY_DN13235_c0_g1_i3:23-430(-)